MKKTIAFIAGFSLCLIAAPVQSRAGDSATAAPTIGKKHEDINQWLSEHPKLKAKALAKFDTNHNGLIDGDEVPAFLKWLKARREKHKELKSDGGKTSKTTPPVITSPTVSQ